MVDFIKLLDPKSIYVIKTNKGYVGGDNYKAVTLVETKEDARRLTVDELHVSFESIRQDMFHSYMCGNITFEVADRPELPTPDESDVQSVLYNSIYEIIRDWDINIKSYSNGYQNGNLGHAKVILDHLTKRLPWLRIGSISIDPRNPNEYDKFSGGFYTCTKCSYRYVTASHIHCPGCGIGVKFEYSI